MNQIKLILIYFKKNSIQLILDIIFFIYNPRCPGQLTRTTTNPRAHWTSCKPSKQIKHRGGDRRTRKARTQGT